MQESTKAKPQKILPKMEPIKEESDEAATICKTIIKILNA